MPSLLEEVLSMGNIPGGGFLISFLVRKTILGYLNDVTLRSGCVGGSSSRIFLNESAPSFSWL